MRGSAGGCGDTPARIVINPPEGIAESHVETGGLVNPKEPIRVMPFCCGEGTVGICVVLGPKKSSSYFREYVSGFSSLRPRICRQLLSLATKDDSDRLLAFPLVAGILLPRDGLTM